MIEKLLQKLAQFIFIPKLRSAQKEIGYQLVFRDIPDRYINGFMGYNETAVWKKFGLDIEAGTNYWTVGKVIHAVSSRFDRSAPEYQSWLGGYVVKLASGRAWTVEDHFQLAIADQDSWLKSYGDPNPMTTIDGWKFMKIDAIRNGQYSGTLYEGGCTTHSDVGSGYKKIRFRLEALAVAALFNFSNPSLRLKSSMMRPMKPVHPYEILKLRGYIAIFDIEEKIKIVLYGDGAVVPCERGDAAVSADLFEIVKKDLINAIKSCEIATVV